MKTLKHDPRRRIILLVARLLAAGGLFSISVARAAGQASYALFFATFGAGGRVSAGMYQAETSIGAPIGGVTSAGEYILVSGWPPSDPDLPAPTPPPGTQYRQFLPRVQR